MQGWEVIMIILGLSLEVLSIALLKGANQKQLPGQMLFFISLFSGTIVTGIVALGIGIAVVPQNVLHYEILSNTGKWFSAVILLFLGGGILKKSKKDKQVEERLEATLTYKEVGMLILRIGIDTLLLGLVFGLLKVPLINLYSLFIMISLGIGWGLWLGQRLGSEGRYKVSACSGIILMIMSMKVIFNFLEVI